MYTWFKVTIKCISKIPSLARYTGVLPLTHLAYCLMKSAALFSWKFSSQGRNWFNLLGKDRPVSRQSTKHSIRFSLIPAPRYD